MDADARCGGAARAGDGPGAGGMNAKTAKLLRRVKKATSHDERTLDVKRTKAGRKTLSHRERGEQSKVLERIACANAPKQGPFL